MSERPPFTLPHPAPLAEGTLLRRRNRFLVEARLEGRTVEAHLPNTGRLAELLVPEAPILLAPAASPKRKTEWDLQLVRFEGRWVHVDSRLASRFVAAAIEANALEPFRGRRILRREPVYGGGRLDLLLEGPAWLEVKSVNLVVEGTARFPDAPTERGRRHLRALGELAAGGEEAHAVFLVQRSDAERFAPNAATDPEFAEILARIVASGVGVHAWSLEIGRAGVGLLKGLPVRV